ncbi:glycosyltransferase family 2 protein [Siphonobacter sp.]|uniref:glycosyltransferase family 2 protein n=1 Tax=Siphonobacter sp. TaxID=1869184 RepID=UPI003B3A7F0C
MTAFFPTITIVTPSYNQGAFIEETIVSVLDQQYPNLEYLIIDGGSTDESVEIIRRYSKYLSFWESTPDRGQSHAINKGFVRSTGAILGWLNSDDLYMPGTLVQIHTYLQEADLVFGNCWHLQEKQSETESLRSDVTEKMQRVSLANEDYIIQPSTFWTRRAWEQTGPLREDLHFAFDWEWFLRAEQQKLKFQYVEDCWSVYRLHESHKTGTGGSVRQEEILHIYEQYAPHLAVLYGMLREEDLALRDFTTHWKAKVHTLLHGTSSRAALLKALHPEKYEAYTEAEVEGCWCML